MEPNPFELPSGEIQPLTSTEFTGAIADGAPINCDQWLLSPHLDTTHTETIRHISDDGPMINQLEWPLWTDAYVARCRPESLKNTRESGPKASHPDDLVITRNAIMDILGDHTPTALIVAIAHHGTTTSKVPPYFTLQAMEYIVSCEIEHLLFEPISVDRIDDDGQLLNHHAFWQTDSKNPRTSCSITERISLPENVADGIYHILIQPYPVYADASISTPVLFPSG